MQKMSLWDPDDDTFCMINSGRVRGAKRGEERCGGGR